LNTIFPLSSFDFDAAVVGAGAVGLACGRALALMGRSVVVVERERQIGQGISSRNSEVIHAGLYYPTDSLKATLCVQGRRLLYPFLDAHGVGYEKCGKIVVATCEAEIPRVEAIAHQAKTNGVEGLRLLTAAEVRALEPEAHALMGLWSPETGIFDSHGYLLALQGEIEAHGGTVAIETPFEGATPLPGGGYRIRTAGEAAAEWTAGQLVIASGLGAQAAAARIDGYPAAQIPNL
jgi:L-2-hydroxyglutarate oxidase LhgO